MATKEKDIARALNELCTARLSLRDQENLVDMIESYFIPTDNPHSKHEYYYCT